MHFSYIFPWKSHEDSVYSYSEISEVSQPQSSVISRHTGFQIRKVAYIVFYIGMQNIPLLGDFQPLFSSVKDVEASTVRRRHQAKNNQSLKINGQIREQDDVQVHWTSEKSEQSVPSAHKRTRHEDAAKYHNGRMRKTYRQRNCMIGRRSSQKSASPSFCPCLPYFYSKIIFLLYRICIILYFYRRPNADITLTYD